MKRPRSHEIDEIAMRIFRDLLPSAWAVNATQHPDYGKDYLIELVEQEKLTGVNFFVQLKGTDNPLFNKTREYISYSLQTKHVTYYGDTVLQPVFLILIDVQRKAGFWLFVQEYVDKQLKNTGWRRKKTVAVRIPAAHLLTDGEALARAVKRSHSYMAARHPSSILGAITAHKQRLEGLDPRVEIRINATDSVQQYTVVAKEPFEVNVEFSGKREILEPKLHDLFKRGLPVTFEPEEILLRGSPLLEHAFSAGGTLQLGCPITGDATLTGKSCSGQALASISFPIHIEGGTEEFRIEGGMQDSPFRMRMTFRPSEKSTGFNFSIDLARWHGQPLQYLAHFDELWTFLTSNDQYDSCEFRLTCRGNEFLAGGLRREDLPVMAKFNVVLEVLHKARTVARHFNVSPVLPADFGPRHAPDIECLFDLVTKGEHRRPLPVQKFATTITKIKEDSVRELLAMNEGGGFIRKRSLESQVLPFLGIEIPVPQLDETFTNVLLENRSELEKSFEKRLPKQCVLRFQTQTSTEQIVSFVDEAADDATIEAPDTN